MVSGCLGALVLAGVVTGVLMGDRRELAVLNEGIKASLSSAGKADSSVILDRRGKPLAFWGENFHRHQPLAELGKIPRHALIAAEDQRFYSGLGIDVIAISRELVQFVVTGKVNSGASTISSQLVKHLLGHRRRTLAAKVKEFGYGFYLHRKYSPKQLLTAYINRVYVGQRSVGFRAAAWRYFGRPYSRLNTKEQLSLLALIPSPSRNNPIYSRANHRRLTQKFIARLGNRGALSRKVIRSIQQQSLRYNFGQINPPSIGYFRDFVATEVRKRLGLAEGTPLPKGLRVATGYDSRHHRQTVAAIRAGEFAPLEQKVAPAGTPVQAAALWVDSASGEITVMIGGRSYRQSRYNRTVLSLRSPGSTLKPIIVALAMKNGYRLTTRFQNYRYSHHPVKNQNYDPSYLNLSLLEGFTLSSNHLMLRLGETIGLRRFLTEAQRLGVHTPLKPEWGSIIGSSEVAMFDLARLYATFAADGRQPEIHGIRRISRGKEILYEAYVLGDQVLAAEVSQTMRFALRRAAVSGVGGRSEARQLGYGGKTGTSNGMRDNWYCGIAGSRVGVVWVGADQGQGFPGLRGGGSRFALPLWLASLPKGKLSHGGMADTTAGEPRAEGSSFPEYIDLSGGAKAGASDSIEAYFAPLYF